ncbi:hypothetical protein HX793_25740 [Pseudomonas reactans]|uniref:hypothetical protein n=1 Tax=Pseudomonas reactans TaxID=117680 RepID=UPI0015B92553|nr:hypothetical protein [Pseudomonas reactans]NWD33197.1 hypothetical protein [Pseudomonas reactans]
MNNSYTRILLLALITVPLLVNAAENEKVCVKYKKEYGWSQAYEVNAKVLSGSDLMAATGNYSRYRSYATYAVIFWDKGEATILEMPASSMGDVPTFNSTVKDMDGRDWQLSQSNGFCY